MKLKREEIWMKNYNALREYIHTHHQLPDKKKVENRGLLNWWKYNKRSIKEGRLDAERTRLLQELSDMRKICKQKIINLSSEDW